MKKENVILSEKVLCIVCNCLQGLIAHVLSRMLKSELLFLLFRVRAFQCFITHHKGEYTLVCVRVTVCIALVVMRFLITVLLICFNKNISLHYC